MTGSGSTSPTRYYASTSRRNSRDTSRPNSPPTTAEVRSQAIAKLKRAASLPRTPQGKRPPPVETGNAEAGPSSLTPNYTSLARPAASPSPADVQEVLSPSPVNDRFNHARYYPSPQGTPSGYPPSAFDHFGMEGDMMQRSASASSSYHMPTPPLYAGGYQSSSPFHGTPSQNHPDWTAVQLAQSYLPSLSPAGLPIPSFNTQQQIGGRNTPSPLPSLGELRSLQRSNSAMARAHAMSKLTGGRNTPSDEDHKMGRFPSHPGLQRADTLGPQTQRSLGLAQLEKEVEAEPKDDAAENLAVPRPRLQRSFTVSSSNMGEERRSAVGRRMVMRLGERRAARQQEEEEVRRLWEEKRAAADRPQDVNDDDLVDDDNDIGAVGEGGARAVIESTRNIPQDILPVVPQRLPVENSTTAIPANSANDLLGVPDRPVSRSTMRSADEAFEYEAHLRRSLSSRTARGAVGTVAEPVPGAEEGPNRHTEAEEHIHDPSIHQALEPLGLPQPSYSSTSRHAPHASTSSEATVQGQSPGESVMSRDGIGSMMFVMGGNGAGKTDAWPSEVGDHGGSDWGTPAREQHPTFDDSPRAKSPLSQSHEHMSPAHHSPSQSSPGSTPPGASHRTSVMSWEEVGGPEDQTVPSDARYHKKSGSISVKLGGKIRTAMKKRRSSASSSTEGVSTSPKSLTNAFQNFSRRESESSLSPSQASAARSLARGSMGGSGQHVRQQPSVSSLSPSIQQHPAESSPNSALLQHQLSSEPSPVSWLPRAAPHDPRIHSSKLSPFPGIAVLGAKGDTLPEPPKLFHQVSDSAVPSQHRTETGPESIYSLPLPPTSPGSRRASDDSAGKRSWLAKAFGQTSTPRSSGGVSRQSSTNGMSRQGSSSVVASLHARNPSADVSSSDHDPFAGPPPAGQSSRHRSASPTVSVVPELSEEGSRLTRFTTNTQRLDRAASPITEESAPSAPPRTNHHTAPALPDKSKEILRRMDALLDMGPDDPARPDILDDPPRKLLLSTQILQVVNAHTAKDRYLFLFNDILVITKPIITHGTTATLDMKFMVKWVVSLDKLAISGFEDEPTSEPPRHAVVQSFIEQFAQNPVAACKYLVERSNPRVDAVTLASLIFKTPELDRTQIGVLLAGNDRLMRAFVDRFHFSGVRIDDALRMFLLAVRLPADPTAGETLLRGFAHRYFEANRDIISYSRDIAEDLVLWIMQLNDSLYGMYGFALPNHAITLELVISGFQSKDPHQLVHPSLLSDIYSSLKTARIDQALTTSQESKYGRQVEMVPSRLPSKMTYEEWSDEIVLRIPERDERFQIRLLGEGLEFQPELLDFGRGREQKFRVRGLSLGTKSILFDRSGANAYVRDSEASGTVLTGRAVYASVGNTRTVTIERAFMKHTFQVGFVSHTGLKRKYCFSVADASMRRKWAVVLQRQISATKSARSAVASHPRAAVRRAAEVVSLQVLRDALISPEMKDDKAARGILGRPQRSGSVSLALTGATASKDPARRDDGVTGADGDDAQEHTSGMIEVKNGKELVLLCRQNSLLPGVLELLQSGIATSTSAQPGHERDRDHAASRLDYTGHVAAQAQNGHHHRNTHTGPGDSPGRGWSAPVVAGQVPEPPAMSHGNGRIGGTTNGLERGTSKRAGSGGRV